MNLGAKSISHGEVIIAWLFAATALAGTLSAQVLSSCDYDANGNRISAFDLPHVADARVEAFEPRVGLVGDHVLIYGRNLPAGNATGFGVRFNGVAANLIAIAPNLITVEVPMTASTGPLVVTFPDTHQTDLGTFNFSGVTVQPSEANVFFGQTVQFNATIIGSGLSVTWQVRSLTESTGNAGTIGAMGLYTAPPASSASEFPYLVTATNIQTGRRGYAVIRPACTSLVSLALDQSAAGLILTGNERFCYEFDGVIGTGIDLAYYGLSTTARRLRIRGPSGFSLATAGPGQSLRLDSFSPPEDEAYRVEVEAQLGSAGGFILGFNEDAPPTPIAFNSPVTAAIDVAGQQDRYSFTGVSGTTVTVDISTPTVPVTRPDNVFRLDLLRPDGSIASTAATCGYSTRLDNVAINQNGIWTVRVRSYESWSNCGYGTDTALLTGDYTLTVCNSNAVPIAIVYGQTRSSAFAADCQIVNFEFSGSAGDVVSAIYLGPTITRRIRLFAPDGSQLAVSGQGVGVSLLDVVLPENGVYRLSAEAADANAIGPFSIGLSELADAVPIAFNTPVNAAIDEIAEVDLYTFTGVSGTTVTVDISTPTVPVTRPDNVFRLDLLRPDGSIASTAATCGYSTRLDNVAINQNGIWTVRVRSYESWSNCGYGTDTALLTGDYTLTVCNSNAVPIAIVYGQTRSSAFAADCQIVNFEFSGSAGDVVSAIYLGPTITRRIRLFAPDGSQLAVSGQGVGVSLLDVVLPENGVYRLSAEAADANAIGPFSIGLSELADAVPIAFNTPVNAAIDEIAEVDLYTFTGVSGTTVTVDISTPTVPVTRPDNVFRLDLLRPDGSIASTAATCGYSTRLDNVAINQNGIWTVRVRSYESWSNCGYGTDTALLTGDYTLTVCNSNAVPIAIVYGQTRSSAFAADCQIVNFEFSGSAGDVVSAIYLGPTITRRIRLFAPDGSQLAVSGQGVGVSLLDVVLPENGVYRLSAEAADANAIGPFSIGLSELADAVPIAFNTPVNAAIDEIAEVDLYTFTGVSGTTVTVDISTPTVPVTRPDNVFRLDLLRPDGSIASTAATCGYSTRLDNVAINQNGIWTVRVRSYESWSNCGYGTDTALLTGDYTLTVCNSNAVPIAIVYGQTRSSAFAADCQIVNFEFSGSAGDVVSAIYLGPTITRRIRLFAPDGSQLAVSGQGVGVSLLDVVLPENGVYRLSAEAADANAIGPFSIGLSELADAVPIAFNTPVNAAIDEIAEVDLYTFTGVSGTTVTVDISTPTVPVTRPDNVFRLDLLRPDGSIASTAATCGYSTRLDNVAINQNGIWTVRVRSYESWSNCGYGTDTALLTGDYTLTVCNSNAVPIAIVYGQTRSSAFAADCQIVNFEFSGSAGDVVSAIYLGPTITRRIRLFAPDGSQLAVSGQGVGVSLLDVVLPENGVYRLSAEAADANAIGPFSIGLSELADAVPIAFNTPVNAAIDEIAEVDLYTFTGVSGTTVTVDISTPTVPVTRPDNVFRLDLLRPDGSIASTAATCGYSTRLDNVAINQNGIWTVRVRSYESWSNCGYGTDTALLTGDYTLTVCNTTPCGP